MKAGPGNRTTVAPHPPDEERLIDGLRAGDRACQEHLVRAHGGRMLAVARRLLRDEEDARDCVQDAFLKVFKKIHTFEERASLRTWFHRIVLNEALMRIRARERRRESSLDDLLPEFDANDCRSEPYAAAPVQLETLLESREVRALVRRSIDQLPESYRIVLILRDIEEFETEETARLLGLSTGAVKTRLHRARAALRTLLDPIMRNQRS